MLASGGYLTIHSRGSCARSCIGLAWARRCMATSRNLAGKDFCDARKFRKSAEIFAGVRTCMTRSGWTGYRYLRVERLSATPCLPTERSQMYADTRRRGRAGADGDVRASSASFTIAMKPPPPIRAAGGHSSRTDSSFSKSTDLTPHCGGRHGPSLLATFLSSKKSTAQAFRI